MRAAGCSKRPSSKAAASEDREAYPLGYDEDLNDARTLLADFFSSLLSFFLSIIEHRQGQRNRVLFV